MAKTIKGKNSVDMAGVQGLNLHIKQPGRMEAGLVCIIPASSRHCCQQQPLLNPTYIGNSLLFANFKVQTFSFQVVLESSHNQDHTDGMLNVVEMMYSRRLLVVIAMHFL
jgi:hypothetical protein